MTIIANNPFTQLLNLNILGELRIKGELVVDDENIVEVSTGTYTLLVGDRWIYASVNTTITLLSIEDAIHAVGFRAADGVTITLTGPDTIGSGITPITSNQSITIVPLKINDSWEYNG